MTASGSPQPPRMRLEELQRTIDRVLSGGLESARLEFAADPARDRLKAFFTLTRKIESREKKYQADRVAERRSSIFRAFFTFSIASTLALILIGSIYALVRRYLAERSKADKTLRESEARVRLLLDSAGEGVYGVDCRGTCTFCNPSAFSFSGSSRPSRSSAGTCTT